VLIVLLFVFFGCQLEQGYENQKNDFDELTRSVVNGSNYMYARYLVYHESGTWSDGGAKGYPAIVRNDETMYSFSVSINGSSEFICEYIAYSNSKNSGWTSGSAFIRDGNSPIDALRIRMLFAPNISNIYNHDYHIYYRVKEFSNFFNGGSWSSWEKDGGLAYVPKKFLGIEVGRKNLCGIEVRIVRSSLDLSPKINYFAINGNTSGLVTIPPNGQILLEGEANHSYNYWVSVDLADQWWNTYGNYCGEWLSEYDKERLVVWEDFNLRTFCSRKGFTLSPGNYYKVSIAADNPWTAVASLIYLEGPSTTPTPPSTPTPTPTTTILPNKTLIPFDPKDPIDIR
ncbi:MAG: hypothetical protein JXJ04_25180, partial [Spirochaetales bacterium]|nr:hypothetical protein [Spirochaetales bacterium]